MKTFNDYIKSIKDGVDLSSNESEDAFDQILLQKVDYNKIIDFLTSLSNKGEAGDEIFGAVKSIKKKSKNMHRKNFLPTHPNFLIQNH